MGANLVLKSLAMLAIIVGFLLLFAAQATPALASGPVQITTSVPQGIAPNSSYNLTIYFNDSGGAIANKSVTLSVTSPNGTATINSSVTTNATGFARVTLHTSLATDYNNITATYSGTTSNAISIWVNPAYSLNLTTNYAFRPANGLWTSIATASVDDQFGNPVGNATVNFTINNISVGSRVTDSSGNASLIIGPYPDTFIANVTANTSGINTAASNLSTIVMFLNRNNVKLFRFPASSLPVGSAAEVDAKYYLDLGNSTPAVGVPLTFTVRGPDYSLLDTYTGVTDANGTVRCLFTLSPIVGNNTIDVTNDDLGAPLARTTIFGEGGDVSDFMLTSSPLSPIIADGSSTYTLNIWAVDSGGNPVKNKQVSVVKNYDVNYTISVMTNSYGYASVNIPPSSYVCSDMYNVSAINEDTANNTTKTIYKNITLSYIAGAPANIMAIAEPNTVANYNVTTPDGMRDVHSTDIIATVTDNWGHPLPGQVVNITSLNTTLGWIVNNSTGFTGNSGDLIANFTLNTSNRGNNVSGNANAHVGVPVRVDSGPLNTTCYVMYTDSAFISVNTTIKPKYNLSVNDTVHVNISLSGIGWKVKGQGYDIALIFDCSGSMDWLSNTIYPTNNTSLNGTINPINTNYPDIVSRTVTTGGHHPQTINLYDFSYSNWYPIYNFTYIGDGSKPIQIMLSSSYYNYDSNTNDYYSDTGTYYYLKVADSYGNNYSTYEYYLGGYNGNTKTPVGGSSYDITGSVYTKSANENYVTINSPTNGTRYTIYGAYHYHSNFGSAPYNTMVLTSPKRLGQSNTDLDSAAKSASTKFVGDPKMSGNQISVIWFNQSSSIARHLTVVDSTNRSKINSSINLLAAYRGTQISDGINSAIAELNNRLYNNSSNKKAAILISDGYSQTPLDDIQAANASKASNIQIFTIGMGMPDEYNLQNIANITGGNYTKVMSDVQLQNVMGGIAANLNKVVANNTSLHAIVSNNTTINGTIIPDATFVTGSANITYCNGTKVLHVPTTITQSGTNLSWYVGTINLSETWSVEYDLKLVNPNEVEPISNLSFINFTTADGPQAFNFTSEPIFVNGSSSNNLSNSLDLGVNITSPNKDSSGGYNITSTSQRINWTANYTGSTNYTQTVRLVDSMGNFLVNLVTGNHTGNNTDSYTWNLCTTPGNYVFTVTEEEILPVGTGTVVSDAIRFTIQYNSDYGLIKLE